MNDAAGIVGDWVDALIEQYGAEGLQPLDIYGRNRPRGTSAAVVVALGETSQVEACGDTESTMDAANGCDPSILGSSASTMPGLASSYGWLPTYRPSFYVRRLRLTRRERCPS